MKNTSESNPPNPPPAAATSSTAAFHLNITNEDIHKFEYDEVSHATKNFKAGKLVGTGGFGNVYRGNLDSIKQEVAVKKLNPEGNQGSKEFIAEVVTLSNLRHENIVQLIGYCIHNEDMLLVYEFMTLGSLDDFLFESLSGKRSGTLDWNTRIKIATETAEAVQYLHNTANPPIIHRDLKSSNILLGDGYKVKLSDFGLATPGPTGDETFLQTKLFGTMGYCDPYYAETGQLTFGSDVYSFGVLLLELITGKRCNDKGRSIGQQNLVVWAKPTFEDINKFKSFVDPLLQDDYPTIQLQKVIEIVSKCVEKDPKDRPKISDVVKALKEITSQIVAPNLE